MGKLHNILIVEDDSFISDLYNRSLKKAGYKVTAAITGSEGLEEAKTEKYDLILLDIMVPDITGIEILNELRKEDNSGLPNTKIIITTNLDQDDSSRAELEAKADGYLIKADVTPRKLIEIIQQLEEFGEVRDVPRLV